MRKDLVGRACGPVGPLAACQFVRCTRVPIAPAHAPAMLVHCCRRSCPPKFEFRGNRKYLPFSNWPRILHSPTPTRGLPGHERPARIRLRYVGLVPGIQAAAQTLERSLLSIPSSLSLRPLPFRFTHSTSRWLAASFFCVSFSPVGYSRWPPLPSLSCLVLPMWLSYSCWLHFSYLFRTY